MNQEAPTFRYGARHNRFSLGSNPWTGTIIVLKKHSRYKRYRTKLSEEVCQAAEIALLREFQKRDTFLDSSFYFLRKW